MALTTTNAPRAGELDESDRAFVQHLKAEADTTFSDPPDVNAVRIAFNKLVDRYGSDAGLTKADLYALDRLLLNMVSSQELLAEAPGLYRRYCQELGESVDPNDPAMAREDATKVGTVRARLQQILRGLHWSYTFGPIREKVRVGLIEDAMKAMIIATGLLMAIVGTLYVVSTSHKPFFAVLSTVVYAGVMGGLASCTLRLTEVPTRGDALGSIYALKNSRYVLFFSPLTGAVFAVVAMGLFMAQVLTGALFPSFPVLGAPQVPGGDWNFTQSLLPAQSKDYALLFLWCFIAGFAERFVPDTLSELIQRGRASGKPAGPELPAPRDGGSARDTGKVPGKKGDGPDNIH